MSQRLPSTRPENASMWRWACALLLIVATFASFYELGTRPFIDYDEAIYAQVIQDTAASDNPLVIQSRGSPFFDKPPLYYWAGVLSQEFFSKPEFSYRLPAALAEIVCIALVMLILLEVTGSYAAAFIAGLILFTTPLFFEAGRQVRLDVLVTSGILLTFYSFIRGLRQPRWFLGIGIGLAIGILTKNVIGALAIPVILIWAIVHRDNKWLKNWYFWSGIALGAVLLAPWHLLQTIFYGERFWETYLGFSVIERFQTDVVGGGVTPSNYYYIYFLLTFAFPWTWLAPVATLLVTKTRDRWTYTHRAAIAFGVQFAFLAGIFFLAGTKIPYYLIPSLAFLSLFLALTFHISYQFLSSKYKTAAHAAFFLVTTLAVINTIFVGYHFQKMMFINDVISSNEHDIGLVIKSNSDLLPIYSYEYPYWDTISFYSGKTIQEPGPQI